MVLLYVWLYGYVKYEEAEVHRSAIMQNFQDNEIFFFKCMTGGHSSKFVMGYPCVRHYILFYIRGPPILHFFLEFHKYHKIIKIQNGH